MNENNICETWCEECGCCEHGEADDGIGCRMTEAPTGATCPGQYCGCEGGVWAKRPEPCRIVDYDGDDEDPRQLHQALSLW